MKLIDVIILFYANLLGGLKFNTNAVCHSYFLIPRQSFYAKRAKSLEKLFSAVEIQFD